MVLCQHKQSHMGPKRNTIIVDSERDVERFPMLLLTECKERKMIQELTKLVSLWKPPLHVEVRVSNSSFHLTLLQCLNNRNEVKGIYPFHTKIILLSVIPLIKAMVVHYCKTKFVTAQPRSTILSALAASDIIHNQGQKPPASRL